MPDYVLAKEKLLEVKQASIEAEAARQAASDAVDAAERARDQGDPEAAHILDLQAIELLKDCEAKLKRARDASETARAALGE